jgi:hypothetical protein
MKHQILSYKNIPEKFFLGWNKYTIDIVKERFINTNKKPTNIQENSDIGEYLIVSDKVNENIGVDNKKSQISLKVIKNSTKESYIREISETRGITIEDIYLKAAEYIKETKNIISPGVGLYLTLLEFEKKAPQCKHITKKGKRREMKTRDKTGYCQHLRKINDYIPKLQTL